MPKKKITTNDLFDGIDVKSLKKVGRPPDPDEALMLSLLRASPKHPDFLLTKFKDPRKVIDALKAKGHVIKGIKFRHLADWVWVISEGGVLMGVPAEYRYTDPDSLPKDKK